MVASHRTPQLCFSTQARAWHTAGPWKMFEERGEGGRSGGREGEQTQLQHHGESHSSTTSQPHSLTATGSSTQSIRLSHTCIQVLNNMAEPLSQTLHDRYNTVTHKSLSQPQSPSQAILLHTWPSHHTSACCVTAGSLTHTHGTVITRGRAHSLKFLPAEMQTSWGEDRTWSVTLGP